MIRQFTFLYVLLIVSVNSFAVEVNVEFSADALQVAPGRSPVYSKMFVSKHAVRTEMMQQGQKLVEIVYPKQGKRLLLNLDKKTYMEQQGPAFNSSSGKKTSTPCEGVPGATCKKLGKEKIQNIVTEKWQVERKMKDKTYRSLHWIDNNRRLAIKEMLADGSVTELIMRGKSDLNGRKVEQWESRLTGPSGLKNVSRQWYDPQLKIVIREEMEGGYLRELNNIKVGKQNKKLFVLPQGFTKITQAKQK